MFICVVSLTLRRCSVPLSTPHSSGFRKPSIWTLLNNLKSHFFSKSLVFTAVSRREGSYDLVAASRLRGRSRYGEAKARLDHKKSTSVPSLPAGRQVCLRGESD